MCVKGPWGKSAAIDGVDEDMRMSLRSINDVCEPLGVSNALSDHWECSVGGHIRWTGSHESSTIMRLWVDFPKEQDGRMAL